MEAIGGCGLSPYFVGAGNPLVTEYTGVRIKRLVSKVRATNRRLHHTIHLMVRDRTRVQEVCSHRQVLLHKGRLDLTIRAKIDKSDRHHLSTQVRFNHKFMK